MHFRGSEKKKLSLSKWQNRSLPYIEVRILTKTLKPIRMSQSNASSTVFSPGTALFIAKKQAAVLRMWEGQQPVKKLVKIFSVIFFPG